MPKKVIKDNLLTKRGKVVVQNILNRYGKTDESYFLTLQKLLQDLVKDLHKEDYKNEDGHLVDDISWITLKEIIDRL